ncbi:hypothetical protein TUN199_11075 [Pyrenophora tritici-repentis]|nr:hypothetical protein TUN199_11075 [Pyrenophora tritici-repentis]KAI1672326.1 hypothetical protein L13192_03185 [Pyrenophora tritici-repentis]KAI1686349.1 hypothetical protein KJE20_04314 [Pyrenophora tritici-repentis]
MDEDKDSKNKENARMDKQMVRYRSNSMHTTTDIRPPIWLLMTESGEDGASSLED